MRSPISPVLDELNPEQRRAASHGAGEEGDPRALLIIAGAGCGKTKTLAHRVAHLIARGADPSRILLLTFTRRAALEMTRRAQALAQRSDGRAIGWAGTFHAIANRLLRLHARELALDPGFTLLDRGDSADLLDLLRHRLGFSKAKGRFPQKGTCLAIYSRAINLQQPLKACLEEAFPWCTAWTEELRALFRAYAQAKWDRHTLDYDDLLLYWFYLMSEPAAAARVAARFEHVLVDEYQDTNALQAAILLALKPSGSRLTVVGDDAQSIYSFRGATVRNILDYPRRFSRAATVITLQQNYRSTQPILDAANAVIALAPERFTKSLFSLRRSDDRPTLVSAEDEGVQVQYVVQCVLQHRESGSLLRQQAVLFRAAHHSDALEVELARRGIPFVKYGGLRFLEAAHVKDLICILRWAENPLDSIAGFRVLQLIPGVGPATAHRVLEERDATTVDFDWLPSAPVPDKCRGDWSELCTLMAKLRRFPPPWHPQLALIRQWYEPHLERLYDHARFRAGDLDQLEQIAAQHSTREQFISELMLDPPEASGAEAAPPVLDEDYLVLSTIHSAKGQEWDVVYLLNVVDGCIPSDMAVGSTDQLEEERRLLYVAMTRAKNSLYLVQPLRMFVRQQPRHGDRYLFAPRSRFIPDSILGCFERRSQGHPSPADQPAVSAEPAIDLPARVLSQWS